MVVLMVTLGMVMVVMTEDSDDNGDDGDGCDYGCADGDGGWEVGR